MKIIVDIFYLNKILPSKDSKIRIQKENTPPSKISLEILSKTRVKTKGIEINDFQLRVHVTCSTVSLDSNEKKKKREGFKKKSNLWNIKTKEFLEIHIVTERNASLTKHKGYNKRERNKIPPATKKRGEAIFSRHLGHTAFSLNRMQHEPPETRSYPAPVAFLRNVPAPDQMYTGNTKGKEEGDEGREKKRERERRKKEKNLKEKWDRVWCEEIAIAFFFA